MVNQLIACDYFKTRSWLRSAVSHGPLIYTCDYLISSINILICSKGSNPHDTSDHLSGLKFTADSHANILGMITINANYVCVKINAHDKNPNRTK